MLWTTVKLTPRALHPIWLSTNQNPTSAGMTNNIKANVWCHQRSVFCKCITFLAGYIHILFSWEESIPSFKNLPVTHLSHIHHGGRVSVVFEEFGNKIETGMSCQEISYITVWWLRPAKIIKPSHHILLTASPFLIFTMHSNHLSLTYFSSKYKNSISWD